MLQKLIFFAAALFLLPISAYADPVMDQINKTQTIRCGYVSYSPASTINPETNKLEGYMIDLMDEIGQRMNLKIEWAQETNWPTMSTDLKTNKFDAGCVAYWSNPRSARQMLTSIPLFYQPVFFLTRADDTRFDANIRKINDKDVSVSVLEGDVPETILKELYPNSKKIALPQNAAFAQVFQEVASDRADVTIAAKPDAEQFMKHNPGILKVINDQPVRLYANVMTMRPGSEQLKNALDVTIREMQLDGTIERIMSKYSNSEDDYYIIEYPYKKLK